METNKERNRRYQKEYRQRHPQKVKERRQKYRIEKPEKDIWYKAKARAKSCGLDFNIEVSDINIPDLCPVLDIPVFKGVGKVHDGSPSLDRVDPNKGYIKGNVVVISHKANRYKGDMDLATIHRLCDYMVDKTPIPCSGDGTPWGKLEGDGYEGSCDWEYWSEGVYNCSTCGTTYVDK